LANILCYSFLATAILSLLWAICEVFCWKTWWAFFRWVFRKRSYEWGVSRNSRKRVCGIQSRIATSKISFHRLELIIFLPQRNRKCSMIKRSRRKKQKTTKTTWFDWCTQNFLSDKKQNILITNKSFKTSIINKKTNMGD
jgi:hypothetical protein